jgi:hypothetical protein
MLILRIAAIWGAGILACAYPASVGASDSMARSLRRFSQHRQARVSTPGNSLTEGLEPATAAKAAFLVLATCFVEVLPAAPNLVISDSQAESSPPNRIS